MLNSKIESLLNGHSLNALSKERENLTHLYKDRKKNHNLNSLNSDNQRLAYIASRLPATHAVVSHVLRECMKRVGPQEICSLLDIGAGPGTVLLAAMDAELPLLTATMIERDPGFIALGRKLTEEYHHLVQNWLCKDVTSAWSADPHDLVVASYSLNELKEKERLQLVEKLWSLSQKFLIFIEPGTKSGFELLNQLRQSMLSKGAHLIAPCPHSNLCPLTEKDWCHFYTRIQRSSFHRKTKDATLNYEDEKFSYLIFAKTQFEPCQSRVLRHPFKGEGFIKLQLCSKNGIEQKTVTKKNKPQYVHTKKIEWGDNYFDV